MFNEILYKLCSLLKECNSIFAPPPDETVAEWTPKNINMSTKVDSIGGPYKPFAYQVDILNESTNLATREIVLKTSAQVAKTWSMLIIAAHRMKHRPCGIVWAMDSKESVEFLSASRFTPMIDESPALSEIVAAVGYRNTKNTKLFKDYDGGWIRFITAGTERALASASAPLVIGDEIDKWPKTKEGDAYGLLEARMKMQINPLQVSASTPSIKGSSKIDDLYEASDKRRFYVPCYHCAKEHLLIWDNVDWDSVIYETEAEYNKAKDDFIADGVVFWESKTNKKKLHFPDTARIVCPECGTLISDYEKNLMVTQGRWIAERPFTGSAGFHLNEMYSPKRTFSDIVRDYLKKKDNPETMQVFVNATLGEVWEIPHESMKSDDLAARREDYYRWYTDKNGDRVEPELPKDGAILTAGVDVQIDRLEVTVRLWGVGYESWGIEHLILYGDPFQDAVWEQLNALLEKQYKHPTGAVLRIQKCAIDSGFATDRVYNFVHRRKWPAVAIKGKGGAGLPVHNGTPTRANDKRVPVYTIGVDTIKNTIYQRSFITHFPGSPAPGCIHWNESYSTKYFKEFTAEKRVKKQTATGFVYVWEKPAGKDNEGFDIEGYAYAALHLCGLGNMDQTIKDIINYDPEPEEEEPKAAPTKPPNTFTDDL
ncbi:MAG: phage terminase large subunit family protein [Candidatus Omnitrophica bacterium]|nr:phage terminase large subunit family protein [Candidatus Omnitrophota bacterium]